MFRKGAVRWIYGADDGHFSRACFRERKRERENLHAFLLCLLKKRDLDVVRVEFDNTLWQFRLIVYGRVIYYVSQKAQNWFECCFLF